jgi:hypothetical protein
MINIPIQNIPNQSLTVTLDNQFHEITIKETNGVMAASIVRNNVPLISNLRVVSSSLVIPCRYQESGNFIILTIDNDLPYYDKFGISQFLIYITVAELAAIYASA